MDFDMELGAIVHPDGAGRPARQRDQRHRRDHLLALDALIDVDRQCRTGEQQQQRRLVRTARPVLNR